MIERWLLGVNSDLSDWASKPYVARLLGNLRQWLGKDPELIDLIEKIKLSGEKIFGRNAIPYC